MAAGFQRTQIGMRRTGTKTTVPNDNRARLMYYLSCIDSILDVSNEAGFNRLKRYSNYWLSEEETDRLIVLCYLLSPDVLINKCIFCDDDMCGDDLNQFYELSSVQTQLAVAGSIVVGGQRRRVMKIMTFKMQWLQNNWIHPIQALVREHQARRAVEERRRRQQSQACTIL